MAFRTIPGFNAYEINREGVVRRTRAANGYPGGYVLPLTASGAVKLRAPGEPRVYRRVVDLVELTFGIAVSSQLTTRSGETWRPILGYQGAYEVSDLGRVRRVGRFGRAGRVLKPRPNHRDRICVQLSGGAKGTCKVRIVARLVAAAFHGPPAPGMEANHINGDHRDDRAVNLEWVSPSENVLHAYRLGLKGLTGNSGRFGEANATAKLRAPQVKAIRAAPGSNVALARRFGVSASVVSKIRNRRAWRHLP